MESIGSESSTLQEKVLNAVLSAALRKAKIFRWAGRTGRDRRGGRRAAVTGLAWDYGMGAAAWLDPGQPKPAAGWSCV